MNTHHSPTKIINLIRLIKRFTMLILLCQPLFADYQTGLDAYNSGDYKTAMYEWKAVVATPPDEITPAIYAETHYAIGMLYWMGQGVPADYLEASKWLHKAAELGHAGAQGKLGYLYTGGITVQKNYETAFEWFSKAARQGDIDGQYNLGIFYLNGWGTGKDTTMAAQYLAAASAQGDEDAEVALQGVLAFKRGEAVDGGVGNLANGTVAGSDPVDLNVHPTGITIHPSTWILQQNPSHYTIQVIALRKKQDLQTLIAPHPELTPYAIYTQQKNNQPIYVLIQGVYATLESARQAQSQFPKTIQPPKNTWIRKFEKIQALVP